MATRSRRLPPRRHPGGAGPGPEGRPPSGAGPPEGPLRVGVRLLPQAGTTAIDGLVNGRLHARVARPAREGEANAALVRLLAEVLGVAPSTIRIVAGRRGRDKVVEVPATIGGRVRSLWPDLRLSSPGAGPAGRSPGRVGD